MSLCLVSPRGLQHSPRSRPDPNPHFFGLSHPLCTLPPVLTAAYGLLALLALVASPSLPLCLPPAVSSSCPPGSSPSPVTSPCPRPRCSDPLRCSPTSAGAAALLGAGCDGPAGLVAAGAAGALRRGRRPQRPCGPGRARAAAGLAWALLVPAGRCLCADRIGILSCCSWGSYPTSLLPALFLLLSFPKLAVYLCGGSALLGFHRFAFAGRSRSDNVGVSGHGVVTVVAWEKR